MPTASKAGRAAVKKRIVDRSYVEGGVSKTVRVKGLKRDIESHYGAVFMSDRT